MRIRKLMKIPLLRNSQQNLELILKYTINMLCVWFDQKKENSC